MMIIKTDQTCLKLEMDQSKVEESTGHKWVKGPTQAGTGKSTLCHLFRLVFAAAYLMKAPQVTLFHSTYCIYPE